MIENESLQTHVWKINIYVSQYDYNDVFTMWPTIKQPASNLFFIDVFTVLMYDYKLMYVCAVF